MNFLGIVFTAVLLFSSTNVDALLMLIMFFSNGRSHPRSIVLGEFLGGAIVVAGSLLCAEASVLIPQNDLAALGIVPLTFGIWQLTHIQTQPAGPVVPSVAAQNREAMVIAMITVSHSADNVAVYVPYFALESRTHTSIVIAVFALLTGVWCWLARELVRHPLAEKMVRSVGRWLTPLVLMALGAWILSGFFRHR